MTFSRRALDCLASGRGHRVEHAQGGEQDLQIAKVRVNDIGSAGAMALAEAGARTALSIRILHAGRTMAPEPKGGAGRHRKRSESVVENRAHLRRNALFGDDEEGEAGTPLKNPLLK